MPAAKAVIISKGLMVENRARRQESGGASLEMVSQYRHTSSSWALRLRRAGAAEVPSPTGVPDLN
jgi:hypothetical protein